MNVTTKTHEATKANSSRPLLIIMVYASSWSFLMAMCLAPDSMLGGRRLDMTVQAQAERTPTLPTKSAARTTSEVFWLAIQMQNMTQAPPPAMARKTMLFMASPQEV